MIEVGRIQFALCGSYGTDEGLNPYAVTKPEIRQEILSLINRELQTPEEIAEMLKLSEEEVAQHLRALEKAGLVARVGLRWRPSFAIFTVQDQERLEPLIAKMAGLFAEVVRDNMGIVRKTYEACGFGDHGFSLAELAYILVGAYILDYGGLALEKSGLLVAAKEMPGGAYVFTGFEGELRNLRASWMWGHSYPFGPFTFFGHGELPPKGPRRGFPEQAYQWWGEGWPEEKATRVMRELGEILVALYESPMGAEELAEKTGLERGKLIEHLALLQELEYVQERGVWTSVCPAVDNAAKTQIQKMVQEIWGRLLDVAVKPHWEHLERAYQGTAPARNGIDIHEAFNPIHHAIFEQALRLLMESGVILWPKRHADGARYAVWIEHGKDA